MKKLLAVVLLLALCAGCAFAEGEASGKFREGHLAWAGVSAEEYVELIADCMSNDKYPWINYEISIPEYSPYYKTEDSYDTDIIVYFDSINEMILALDAGKIDSFELFQPVANYFFRQNNNADKYLPLVYTQGVNYYLSMGFKEGSKWLERFNSAIKAMNEDDTLLFLKAKYVDYAKDDLKPIVFEKFPDAETVKIAVTGDMPPLRLRSG